MGNREWMKEPRYSHWFHCWAGPGIGKFWKRRLNKARRKYIKNLIWFGRGKEPVSKESKINWRNW